ncbi:MAG TPA: cell division protein FtsA [Patescibacteria group bacterium]|nr:cell division protein FtsA [Patescibacteria group bacterium]
MAKDRVVAGIDVGSSKVCTIITTVSQEGSVHVIGVSTVPSKGLKKGQIVDIEDAVSAINAGLESAERMAGFAISSAFISVGGAHINCQNSRGVVAVAEPESEIALTDVDRVIEAAKAITLPSSREIVHVLPRGYIVDSQEGIRDPVGMTGVRLEVETHIITGSTTSMRNLAKCVQEVGVDVESLIFGGVASSEAVLSDTEKELGVVLVDIGGGTTDVCLFIEGALAFSAVIPIGAKHITNDVAIGLRVSLDTAEKIKLSLSKEPRIIATEEGKTRKDIPSDEFDITALGVTEEARKFSRKTLIEGIIRPRLSEIFSLVAMEIKRSGFGGMTPSGVVVTGGGAETIGVSEITRHVLSMPVRIGYPQGVTGLIDEIQGPAFSTSVGLVLYGAKGEGLGSVGLSEMNLPGKDLLKRLVTFVRSFLP